MLKVMLFLILFFLASCGQKKSHTEIQSLLVHEVGHAMGLVENGVPAQSDHHDKEHGSHCTNQDCVMHWLNEGATDMSNYVRRLILTGDENLFGQHCLEDAAQKIQSYQ